MTLTTTVNKTTSRFDMTGQRLASAVHPTDEEISPGLALRLANYAQKILSEVGFESVVSGAKCEVYTLDAEDKPADRAYTVRFKRPEGGYMEVCGIQTRNGWPFLNHGLYVGTKT